MGNTGTCKVVLNTVFCAEAVLQKGDDEECEASGAVGNEFYLLLHTDNTPKRSCCRCAW